jgi:hypothetical protein
MGNIETSSTHSEANYLVTHCKVGDVETLYVVSPYKNRFRYSRPCTNCILIMRVYGVKNVIYSTGDTGCPYILELVDNMPLLKKSRGDTK